MEDMAGVEGEREAERRRPRRGNRTIRGAGKEVESKEAAKETLKQPDKPVSSHSTTPPLVLRNDMVTVNGPAAERTTEDGEGWENRGGRSR